MENPETLKRPPNPDNIPKWDIVDDKIVPANIAAYDLWSKNPV